VDYIAAAIETKEASESQNDTSHEAEERSEQGMAGGRLKTSVVNENNNANGDKKARDQS
jgi:hypothetical protein